MKINRDAPTVPNCGHCGKPAKLRVGSEVYPHRRDLWSKFFWVCEPCEARCGCHGNTKISLGFPANAQLRRARMSLHDFKLDLIWKNAVKVGGYTPKNKKETARITRMARERTYKFLADRLGISRDDCHTALFTLEQCRQAWRVLAGVTYADVRAWAKETKTTVEEAA